MVDVSAWEKHNIVKRGDDLFVRKGLVEVATPTLGTVFVGGFTVESPFTTEPWHYAFEQSTTTGQVTLRVRTEEWLEVQSYDLGFMQSNPVITHAIQHGQLQINSPSLPAPLYGLLGGGLIMAVKTPSIDTDTTTLEIPNGHVCTFGDRMPIAQGNILYFNDPPDIDSVDWRTYVAENAMPFPGVVYDHFQGADGALYVFTSKDVHVIPPDALGKGQAVTGFIATIPGVNTSRPRNALSTNGVVVALERDGITLISGTTVKRLDITPYRGRRYYSLPTQQEDWRITGELYPTPDGFVVGFRGVRPHWLEVNMRQNYRSFISAGSDLNLVGTLRTRDGEVLYMTSARVLASQGNKDFDGGDPMGVLCGQVDLKESDHPVVRRVTISGSAIGAARSVFLAGSVKPTTTPSKLTDVIIGTALWGAGSRLTGREHRTTRHSFDKRVTDPELEIVFFGGDRRLESRIDLELEGQGRTRRDGGG